VLPYLPGGISHDWLTGPLSIGFARAGNRIFRQDIDLKEFLSPILWREARWTSLLNEAVVRSSSGQPGSPQYGAALLRLRTSEAEMTTAKTKIEPVAPEQTPAPTSPKGKLGAVVALLLRPEGATLAAMQEATGWQAHSVRGAMSGSIKKKLGFDVTSEKAASGRVYKIRKGAGA
jgi:hypothetical protein